MASEELMGSVALMRRLEDILGAHGSESKLVS
jgi:hypothetical protein